MSPSRDCRADVSQVYIGTLLDVPSSDRHDQLRRSWNSLVLPRWPSTPVERTRVWDCARAIHEGVYGQK
ncbi:hypothetical protein PVK06_044064 [Gossypium arboreum]|uniref:Uncharacterized protein n=1 Tax=Gossypium arboreum TaxID=29729 RepID=A0ABR0MRW7_GOSAR|nr:hypothetical protein PVK06_044064 [Gossypium arboreum]